MADSRLTIEMKTPTAILCTDLLALTVKPTK